MTDTKRLVELLRQRHSGGHGAARWVMMTEVGSATGFMPGKKRYADAIAVDTWPSRGLEIHGFEIKVQRVDLQRELRDGGKADAIKQFCDRWWLVIPSVDVMEGISLPTDWGVLCEKNGRLRVKKRAPRLETADVSREFLASMLRCAQAQPPPQEQS